MTKKRIVMLIILIVVGLVVISLPASLPIEVLQVHAAPGGVKGGPNG